ncbi:coiled-coil domain-containing protein 62 isoform X1 [Trachemys scripta elegans]|uniref:coiled-coil domain-containing protein 62 isoform X1 n=3 Tax=Trachemys scripta elegans TaxID=31138 RepID=UPI001557E208|nr:coiled-coil domain-containing protein 62 isoform X1 [Trachemys scripta elegans]XP_034646917.1 coiled-coil domain-containing protein 62 isoform X1 [Trachemys scripta elegans]XP_034646918.1 coiled-coil domain-containing protein 62 isoform X1 [Trachemys scripta elegans]XP_034646920.1 coiled-coil domain-containing protein 62 isoform X1 [Trachemys scripta elegans]
MNSSLPLSASPQNPSTDLENSTIQKQRKELQLLIAELKDRDKELNDMVAVHQRQLLAWEDDRQKILTLAERCSRLENELHKRNEMIRTLTQRLKVLESQQNDRRTTLENTQQKLQELSQKATDATLHCQALEEKNQSLNCSVLELSAKIGQLQAREQELITMLKLKDKDILEATNHITAFTSKFKKLESALRAAKMGESSINKEKQDFKLRLKQLTFEMNKLKDDLSEKTKENNEQREEIIRLKQENNYLKNELVLNVEKANRQDQLLQSAKSKQVRTNTELSNLRQIYVKQQQDLQFLHFNLESSQELWQKHKGEAHKTNIGLVLSDLESSNEKDTVSSEGTQKIPKEYGTTQTQKCSLKKICNVCEAENSQLINVSDMEESTSAHLNRLQKIFKGLSRGQKTLFMEDEKQNASVSTDELDSRTVSDRNSMRSVEGRETTSQTSQDVFLSRDQQNFGASLPIHEHWLNFSPRLDSLNCWRPGSKQSDRTDVECNDQTETVGILCDRKSRASPGTFPIDESGFCTLNSIIDKAACYKPVTDLEWMQIFRPIEGDGNVWCRAVCNCPKTAHGIKSTSLKSEEHVDLNSFYLDSPCLTSTQKRDGPQKCERFFDADLPSEISNLSVIQSANKCTSPTDSCSPTSKLQRLLAESRQMVADLELSTLLHISPCCSPDSSSVNMTTELTEALCKVQLPAMEESETKLSLFSL